VKLLGWILFLVSGHLWREGGDLSISEVISWLQSLKEINKDRLTGWSKLSYDKVNLQFITFSVVCGWP
jgi:hypothetical protein